MVSEEVRMFEEEQRTTTAITQAKQCAWIKWNDIKPIKSGCWRRSKEQPLLLLRLNNVLGQNGMISNQLNHCGNP